jgi:hypothetical protein
MAEKRKLSKRRLGYFVWGSAAVVIAVPEIAASRILGSGEDVFPFTTISHMVGHLERHHYWVELIVVAIIVLAVFSAVRVPPKPPPEAPPEDATEPGRTPGGRLTLRPPANRATADEAARFDREPALTLGWFVVAALGSLAVVAGATWWAVERWDEEIHYHPAYVLYGLLGFFWVIVPSAAALLFDKEAFPTLFRTVNNLEEWLRAKTWPLSAGPTLAWLVAYTILAGFVILLLHLTLYPYPDITDILNPDG